MLHILLGWLSENRSQEVPVVLYLGHEGTALEGAIAAAPTELQLERGTLPVLRRARRPLVALPQNSTPALPASDETADTSEAVDHSSAETSAPAEPVADAEAQASGGEQAGPTLDLGSDQAAPKSGRGKK